MASAAHTDSLLRFCSFEVVWRKCRQGLILLNLLLPRQKPKQRKRTRREKRRSSRCRLSFLCEPTAAAQSDHQMLFSVVWTRHFVAPDWFSTQRSAGVSSCEPGGVAGDGDGGHGAAEVVAEQLEAMTIAAPSSAEQQVVGSLDVDKRIRALKKKVKLLASQGLATIAQGHERSPSLLGPSVLETEKLVITGWVSCSRFVLGKLRRQACQRKVAGLQNRWRNCRS